MGIGLQRTATCTGIVAGAFLAFSALLGVACGSTHGAGFAPASSTSAPNDAGDDGPGDDRTMPVGDGAEPVLVLTADASPGGVKFDCQPGTYSGMFKVHVSTDAGLLPQLVSFDVAGSMSITLVGHVSQPATPNGESFAQPVLTIAPGAKLSGVDMTFGGTFSADVSGQLDCPMKTFSGTLANGNYEYPGDSGSLMMGGDLSATYDGTMTPPALTMGIMSLSSPQLQLGSTGPWSATLQ